MLNASYYRNKKLTIIGLARSGLACANLLFDLGAEVSISDNKDTEAIHANLMKLKAKDIKVELGRHTSEFFKARDLIVISPGVANDSRAIALAKEHKIPIISELELASRLCPATIIAVTGSNGKTTVTSLIAKVLEARGKNVFVCGNIGTPFSQEVEKIGEDDFVSLEVSSFQLEWIIRFKPKISVILNFSPNHLDRYKDIKEYLEAKKRIFINQDKSDYLVLNYEDPVLRNLSKETNASVVYFSESKTLNVNQAAVLAVGSILGIEKRLILGVCKEFKGIEHRMEEVVKINNIGFINDSKSTTCESLLWALKNINVPIVLIAGGKDKGSDYSLILAPARKKVRDVVLIGEAKEKIRLALKGALPVDEAITLEEAVRKAYLKAKSGDCVLFSPMCSSFDMFADYKERGRLFKEAVYNLIREQKN